MALQKFKDKKFIDSLTKAFCRENSSIIAETIYNAIIANEGSAEAVVGMLSGKNKKLKKCAIRLINMQKISFDKSKQLLIKGDLSKAVPLLSGNIKQDKKISPKIIETLGKCRNKSAYEKLVIAWKNTKGKDPWIEKKVVESLGYLEDKRAVPLLRDIALHNTNNDIRKEAATALGYIKSDDAEDALIKTLQKEKDHDVKEKTILSLSLIGSQKSIPVILNIFNNRKSIEKNGYKASVALKILCNERSKKHVPALIRLLNTKDGDIAENIIYTLGKTGDRRAMKPLLHILKISQNYSHYKEQIERALRMIIL
jgi:hypothetical protein